MRLRTLALNRVSRHGSIVVSIPRCGRGDPGSNPGRGRVTKNSSLWHAVYVLLLHYKNLLLIQKCWPLGGSNSRPSRY